MIKCYTNYSHNDIKEFRSIYYRLPNICFIKSYNKLIIGASNELGDLVVIDNKMIEYLDKNKNYIVYSKSNYELLKERGFKVEYR